jgi:predicted nucleic acid-binding protein
MTCVVDKSVVSGWFLENQANEYSDAIAPPQAEERTSAPAIWNREFTNVLRTCGVRQRLDAQRAQAVIVQISSLPIDVDREPVPVGELLPLALRFGLSSYDAVMSQEVV